MSERITLEDKLKKCEKDNAQLTINIEKKLGEYKENKTMLCYQNAELESEVTRYRQEKAKLERARSYCQIWCMALGGNPV